MLDALTKHLLTANEDRDVRAIVITGTGRFFCAGLDLRGGDIGGGLSSNAGPANLDLRNTPPTVLHAVDKPTICALNGSAAGYGMDLALGCDIRIMADTAKLAAAFTARGVLPESGGTWILPRLLGWSKAAELIFTGRTLTAAESLEMGLVSRVVPAERNRRRGRATRRRNRAQRPARRAGVETHDAHGHERDVQRPRASRVPAAAAAVPLRRLQGRHGVVPRKTPAELHRQVAMSVRWQARLDALAREFEVPGASLAIWHKGRLTTCATGVINANTAVAATPAAIFQIGSITKLLTATLMMQLVEEGRLRLDDPVRRHLPDFALQSVDAARAITIRQLLTHTSGIDGDFFESTGLGEDKLARYVDACRVLPSLYPPGELVLVLQRRLQPARPHHRTATRHDLGNGARQNICAVGSATTRSCAIRTTRRSTAPPSATCARSRPTRSR